MACAVQTCVVRLDWRRSSTSVNWEQGIASECQRCDCIGDSLPASMAYATQCASGHVCHAMSVPLTLPLGCAGWLARTSRTGASIPSPRLLLQVTLWCEVDLQQCLAGRSMPAAVTGNCVARSQSVEHQQYRWPGCG